MWLWSIKTPFTDKPQLLSRAKKKGFLNRSFFVWWMSCRYNGWALPLQINQTWHCPVLEHLGRPRDRIKGLVRPWTLSVPNMHNELRSGLSNASQSSSSALAVFVSHQLFFFCLICYSHIPQCFRHGNREAESDAAWQYSKSIYELIIPQQNCIFS